MVFGAQRADRMPQGWVYGESAKGAPKITMNCLYSAL